MSLEKFKIRHIGPRSFEVDTMLKIIGVKSVDELIDQTIPSNIRLKGKLNISRSQREYEYNQRIWKIASKNRIFRSFIGLGYYETIMPSVIKRNILENPSWYTSYTPYQPEISQGRLEALLNFQTVIMDLTSMDIANASLLDEATAVAEAMAMLFNARSREEVKADASIFYADENIFPQTMDVLKSRAEPLGIVIKSGSYREFVFNEKVFGALVQYPTAEGDIRNYFSFVKNAHDEGVHVIVAADLMSLTLLTPPGEWGADVVVGSTQRFGIPMGYGGPHAAYFATREKFKRFIPGRIIGVSIDTQENKALRMALQTREQHIKRERATSNICTAQSLLAIMAGMYAVYHGADGLINIAKHIHSAASLIAANLKNFGFVIKHKDYFDTIYIQLPEQLSSENIRVRALEKEFNFWYPDNQSVQISIGEPIDLDDINDIIEIFASALNKEFFQITELTESIYFDIKFLRKSGFLNHRIFRSYFSETEMMRYIKKLERKDFSLTHSMIPLGSCTMKLNAASEMFPLSWPEFNAIHPFAPGDQVLGYKILLDELENDLRIITGFDAVSFMPNSGASGEYTGLLVIRAYHIHNGEARRNVVLIPSSAHGTNPASGVMAGMKVVVVNCDEKGNIDLNDLKNKVELHKDELASFMVTYPSTHGVFESRIKEMIDMIHKYGGQVYMDGANMNAQVGLTSPAMIGADVCHLNLHKTFSIPHGGGGPGMGPIAVAKHLSNFLPNHPFVETGGEKGIHAVSATPYGSTSILPISHAYIKMLGHTGMLESSVMSILNANYLASSLKEYYQVLYTGETGRIAHEFIIDCRPFKNLAGVSETDIAKRLVDYGFHAPTLSFPVPGTLMIEPTESESLQELDRFVEAMISIYHEIMEIKESGESEDNLLKNAPHTSEMVTTEQWSHSYSRQRAAFPLAWIKENKFWPSVARLQDAYGDRNLMCSCSGLEEYVDTNE
ncbi:aminomethyl-transferring glycine dehydrogenase [Bacteroidota bacterium]